MVMTALPLALATLAAMQTSTDTTFAIGSGTRIELRDVRGLVAVQSWDRAEVRVRAEHGSRDRLRIDNRGGVVSIRGVRDVGRPVAVDYRLTVPRGVGLTLDGQEADFEVAGVTGEIRIGTVEGSIVLREVGSASVNSVEGDITIRGATGAIRANTTDGDVTLSGIRGDIVANTLDGDVILEGIEATNVDVSTVDGDISYDGTIRDGGRYRLSTHDGDITMLVPAASNAAVTVATFDGDFESTFPVQMRPGERRGHRFSFTIGSGSAQVELESFDGAIRLRNR